MSRPARETQEDRNAEEQIIVRVCEVFGTHYAKLNPVLYRADYALFSSRTGQLRAYAEVKHRNIAFGYREGVYLSAAKLAHGRELARSGVVPFLFVVRLADSQIVYANVAPHFEAPCIWAGRSDRGDHGDFEPIHLVPWDLFKKLPEDSTKT